MKSYWGVEHGEVSKGLRPFKVRALKAKGKGKSPSVTAPGVSVNVPKGPDTDRMLRHGPDIGRITAGAPDVLAMLRPKK